MKKIKLSSLLLTLILSCTLSSCNKEKASALQIAAQNFQSESVAALDLVGELMRQNVSIPLPSAQETIDKIENDLNEIDNVTEINAQLLDFWTEESHLGENEANAVSNEVEGLKKQYYQFEAIFSSLDKGSLFGKNAVAKAEKHAVNLTVQLINFARVVDKLDVRFTAKRVLLIEQFKAAKRETNEGLRKQLVLNAARQFQELVGQERMLRDKTTKALLSAAQAGKNALDLIRNYEKMSVKDLLVSVRNTMAYAKEITNNQADVTALLTKFDTMQKTISEDPYWKILLDQKTEPRAQK